MRLGFDHRTSVPGSRGVSGVAGEATAPTARGVLFSSASYLLRPRSWRQREAGRSFVQVCCLVLATLGGACSGASLVVAEVVPMVLFVVDD